MISVHPLYSRFEKENLRRGVNNFYIDTQTVNYMRKDSFPRANDLKKLITKIPPVYKLYYSSAHLGDYLKDVSDYKDQDLRFMGEIGMFHYLAYDPNKRLCFQQERHPIDVFYNARLTQEQASLEYQKNRKPKIDKLLLNLYDWFKETLIEYEKDNSFLSRLDIRDANTFLALMREVKLDSKTITRELFVENSERHWKQEIFTLPEKDASRLVLSMSLAQSDLMGYKEEQFDLRQPNIADQVVNSEFKRNIKSYIEESMYAKGLDFNKNYDELTLFMNSYGAFQMLGIEVDTAKKFNIYSTREDAGHCYFASMCNYLITEDDGLYRRAKILYGVLGVTTKVFRINEFLEYSE